jgi:hypothetical protein
MELISVITSITAIIEKIVLSIKGQQEHRDAKSILRIEEAKMLLQDVSLLIEKFSESVDVILETIESAPVEGIDPTSQIWLKTNRRLFEITTDMRILTNSIEKRFPGISTEAIRQITDGCMQITKAENIVLAIIPNSVLDKLPDTPAKLRYGNNYTFVLTLLSEKGYPRDFVGRDLRKRAVVELNEVLLHIITCKEKLSIAVNSVA